MVPVAVNGTINVFSKWVLLWRKEMEGNYIDVCLPGLDQHTWKGSVQLDITHRFLTFMVEYEQVCLCFITCLGLLPLKPIGVSCQWPGWFQKRPWLLDPLWSLSNQPAPKWAIPSKKRLTAEECILITVLIGVITNILSPFQWLTDDNLTHNPLFFFFFLILF